MVTYTKRVQALLTDQQYAALVCLAKERDKPVSMLVREAVETVYFKPAELERRRAILTELLTLDAPVADWPQMEEEIIRGAIE
mgnify:CR=1 FL=1